MVKFEKLAPIIYVRDLATEVAFYQAFGFTISYQGTEFPDFIALKQGGIEFGVQRQTTFSAEEANRAMLWQFEVDDLSEAVAICRERGYEHTDPRRYWEAGDGWDIQVRSPNGYRVNLEAHGPGSTRQAPRNNH